MERQTRSLRLDARELDHLGPFLGFGCNESAELGGAKNHWDGADIVSRALMSAVASPALISRLSRLMISTGVPAGAQTPAQVLASYPGSVSAMVGTSGSMSNRQLPATASARRPPERMCGSDVTITSKATCTCPPTRSVTIGAPPR